MRKNSQRPDAIAALGQVVLVFQGGGALGAYQAGVYEALHEAGIEPDWVIGTSIGAINASLIAGNAPEDRLPRLREFWRRVQKSNEPSYFAAPRWAVRAFANFATISQGIPGFFAPNPAAFWGAYVPMDPEQAGYYCTDPLVKTLRDLVDFERLNIGAPRITVGAAHVTSSQLRYFDSREMALDVRHVAASGALPPAFPAIRIDGELYWDGGILSNTPVEAVFDDKPRRDSLVISVHIWNPEGPEPHSIWDVMSRQKDIQYSSRTDSQIQRQKQLHRLRHIIAELAMRLPDGERASNEVKQLAAFGCLTRMHVVRLLAPTLNNEDHTKDIDFAPESISKRWQAGYADTTRVLAQKPWEGEFDPMEGFVLHEVRCEMPGAAITSS